MAKILIVDDSEKVRVLAQNILLSENHDVLSAADAFSAMEMLEQYRVDLMILDITMPYKDGFSALKSLRKSNRHRFLPVMIMSERHSKRDIEKAANLDAVGYIVKPISAADLLEKVDRILSERKVVSLDLVLQNEHELAISKVTSTLEAKILRVSEIGVDIHSPINFLPGQDLQINSPLFSYIGITPHALRVSSSMAENDGFRIKLIFVGLNNESTVTLKKWIQQRRPRPSAA